MVSELKKLTKPAKIVAIIIAVLFATAGFLVRDTYFRITGSTSDAQAAIARLEKTKLDVVVFERQCDINRVELDKKADKDKVEVIQRRLDQILGILLDPSKKEAVREQINSERSTK